MGPGLTQGFFGYRDYDLAKTNCLVLWGTDPLASNRMVPNTINRFGDILARGTVIAVDPRLSNSAAKAQEWLPIKPGTDGALAGAIAHVLLTEGLWSSEFVGDFKDGKNLFVAGKTVDEAAFAEKETYGFVKWWNLELKDSTPAWAEKETLIPAAQIVRVARAMGKAAPKTAVWMGPGVAMTPRGTYAAMAVHALNGLLGSIDVEGGVCRVSSVPIAAFPKSDAYRRRRRQGRRQVQEDRRPRRQGHAGDDERAARQRRGHQQRRQRHAEGPGRGQGVHLLVGELQLLLHRRRALGQGDGQGAVLRPYGHQPFGDDPVRRHRAAGHVQLRRGLSIVANMGNGYGYASIQQPAVKRLWDVKQEETEVMWLLAEKLKAKGFPNLFDYYSKSSRTRRPASCRPTRGIRRDRGQDLQRDAVDAEGAAEGRRESPAGPTSARRASSAARSTA